MRHLLSVALGVVAAQSPAQVIVQSPGVAEIRAGIYCTYGDEGTAPAPGMLSGMMNLHRESEGPFAPDRFTIPMRLGTTMGVEIRMMPLFGYWNAELVLEHPPMGAEGVTVQRAWEQYVGEGYNGDFYTFDFPYEMVPGTWTFRAKQGDFIIYEVDFEVVAPESAPDIPDYCAGEAISFLPTYPQAG